MPYQLPIIAGWLHVICLIRCDDEGKRGIELTEKLLDPAVYNKKERPGEKEGKSIVGLLIH